MKLRQLALATALTAAAAAGALSSTAAFAQAKEQFFPVLVYRTGSAIRPCLNSITLAHWKCSYDAWAMVSLACAALCSAASYGFNISVPPQSFWF